VERAARNEGIEDLGLRAGSRITVADLGEYGLTVRQQPTVFSAFRYSVQRVTQYNTSVSEWMEREEEGVVHFRQFRVSSEVGLRQADHFSVAMTLNTIQTWANWRPNEVSFQSSDPLGFDLESGLETNAVFSQIASSILLPKWLLAKSIRQCRLNEPDPLVPDWTSVHWIDALRSIIEALLFEECIDIHATAEAAGTSVRSLQRRLLAEGYTYSSLVEQIRFTKAASLLRDPHAKIIDIALDLGYQNPGSFSRAFRRWSGFSPQEFRNMSLGTELETELVGKKPA
jgi:AraC-like DNA-binding protein